MYNEYIKQVKIYTFGFGSDHDEQLLSDIASAGQGSYYYVEKEDQIAAAFADALGGLLSVERARKRERERGEREKERKECARAREMPPPPHLPLSTHTHQMK